MGPTKTVVTIVEAALIFRAVSWIVKSQHLGNRLPIWCQRVKGSATLSGDS
jgi:hypothetical protein